MTIRILLKRTFNQSWPDGTVTRFWRIVGPQEHPSLGSDLSIEGMREWGIL